MTDDIEVDSSGFAELTGFQRDVMVILAGSTEVNGLDLKEELETYYNERINHGRLYPNLDTLVESGLVAKFEIDKRTNGYELTPFGTAHITARVEWQQSKFPEDQTSLEANDTSAGPQSESAISGRKRSGETGSAPKPTARRSPETGESAPDGSSEEETSTRELVEDILHRLRQMDDS